MHVDLVSPERILYSGEADMVVCRATDGGEIAFLTGHAPFLGALEIELVRIKKSDGEEEAAAVHGGFVHVREDQVIVLSDVAELPDQIDVERARRAQEAAERSIAEGPSGPTERGTQVDDAKGQAALARALLRQRLVERYG